MAHRILRLCRNAALAVVLAGTLAALPRESSAVITLTGVNEFSTDNSGNWTSDHYIWDTRGNINTAYGLWMINGTFGGPFLNGPDMANAPINVPLPNGIYTCSFHGDGFINEPGPASNPRWGMNLFFNGDTYSPGISVTAAEKIGGVTPPFSPNASSSTPNLRIQSIPAANSRSFASGGQAVTITAYQWSNPAVLNVNRVSPSTTTFDGFPDYTGQITLNVYSISSNTWVGFAPDNNWTSAGNWTADGGHDGVAPANDGTANVIFAGSNRTTLIVDPDYVNVASMTFDSTAAAFTLQGNGNISEWITVQSGGIINNSSQTQTIQKTLLLGASQTWTTAAGNLSISGDVGLQGNNLTVDGPFTSATTISGQIIDGSSGALIKNGTCTLTLSGSSPNNYSGPTIVNQGILQLAKPTTNATITGSSLTIGQIAGTSGFVYEYFPDQIGDSTPVTINPFSTLYMQGTTSDYLVSSTFNGGSVSTGGTTGFISLGSVTTNSNSNTASVSGRVNQNVGFTWNVAAGTTPSRIDLDVPAEVFGPGSLVKNGAGALRLSGKNTFSGGLTANAGTVVISGNSALTSNESAVEYGPVGTGTLTIQNATIQCGDPDQVLYNPINLVSGTPGPTFSVTGEVVLHGPISGTGGFTMNGPGELDLDATQGSNFVDSYAGPTVVNSGRLTLFREFGPAITGSGLIIGDGVHSAVVAAVENYGIAISTPVTINFQGELQVYAPTIVASVAFNGGEIDTTFGDVFGWVSTGQITVNASSHTASILGQVNQNATFTWNVAQGTTANGIDFDVPALIYGPGGVIKRGQGTARVSGTNTYAGGTTVQGGIFRLGANGAAGTGLLTVVGGTFDLNGFNQTVPSVTFGDGSATSAATVSGAGTLTINGDIAFNGSPIPPHMPPATLASNASLPAGNHNVLSPAGEISSGIYDLVIGGNISGNGGLTFGPDLHGSMNYALTGQNTYLGPTTITSGALFLGAANALPSQTAVSVASGSLLDLNPVQPQPGVTPGNYSQSIGSLSGAGLVELGSASLVVGNDNTNTQFSGSVSGNGSALVKTGSGTLNVTGPGNRLGAIRVAAGALVFNIAAGTPSIASGVTVTVNPGAVLELAGPISALGSAGGHRAHIVNESTGAPVSAAGLVVSGSQQVVGKIDGPGTTQANAGSDLTADHIVQAALIIGGQSGGSGFYGRVTVAASDATGNPLDEPAADDAGDLGLGASDGGAIELCNRPLNFLALDPIAFGSDSVSSLPTSNSQAHSGGPAVPEPTSALLLAFACVAIGLTVRRNRLLRARVGRTPHYQ